MLLYFYDYDLDIGPPGPKHVETYFEVLTDEEIDNDLYCASANIQKRKHIFSDQDIPFDCFEEEMGYSNIYDIDIDEEEPC